MKKIISIICLVSVLLVFSTVTMAENVPVTGISVETNIINLEIGQTKTIIVMFYPDNVTNKEIRWSSSNYNIATVNARGEVKGVSAGVSTITGTTVDGGYNIKITINVSGQSSIRSNKYAIIKKENSLNEEIRYITKIDKKTLVKDFKNNIETYANMEFSNLSNKIMKDDEQIGTGVTLKLSDNSKYVLSVTGDVNSDGNVSIVDLSRFKTRIVGLTTLDDSQEVAADTNFDDKITLTDLANLKMYLVGLKQNF